MVFARILISLPLIGLRPARALRLRGRKVPKPTTVTRLPFATFSTIASNTAFTASPAAALLRLPAFAATCTRSDFVTTCGILFSPPPLHRLLIVSKPKWKDNELAHARAQSIYDYARGGFIMHSSRTLAAAALGCAALATPLHAQTTLTYSSWVPPTHHLTIWQANWAAEVEKATGGRVKFQSLPKAPAAPPGTFDAVRDGLVDLSYVTASYTPARHILPLMAELPGMADTSEVNSVAYSRIHWKHFHKVGEYKGVKLLAVWTHGPGQMFTKKPVRSIADVQGLKIRTGGGVAEQVAKALGASAFVKPAPESYELLSSGVADGVFFPLESIISFKLDTVLEQATLFPGGMYSSSFGFFMNEDKWNRLPRQDQEAIEKISGEHIARLAGASWDEADRKGMEQLKKSGVKIVNADPEFVIEVRKRSAPIVEDWITKAKAKGVDAAKVLAEFREELKKVAAGK